MEVSLGGRTLHFPATPHELTLGQWIKYCRQDKEAGNGTGDATEAWMLPYTIAAEEAYKLSAFFGGVTVDKAKETFPFAPVMELGRSFGRNVFTRTEEQWQGRDVPAPILCPGDGITFGEFIDSKVLVQAGTAAGSNRWEIIRQLAAIWLRSEGEDYEEAFVRDGSERLRMIDNLPIGKALHVAGFWEEMNDFCASSFTIFRPSSVKGGRYTAKHFEIWGWVNFLKAIAKTKVFDVHSLNLNSIECARRAPAYDVLIYASEEKDFGEAQYHDQREAMKR